MQTDAKIARFLIIHRTFPFPKGDMDYNLELIKRYRVMGGRHSVILNILITSVCDMHAVPVSVTKRTKTQKLQMTTAQLQRAQRNAGRALILIIAGGETIHPQDLLPGSLRAFYETIS